MSKKIDGKIVAEKSDACATDIDEFFDLDVLRELGSMGAGHAATSLAVILQQPVAIELPRVHAIPPHMIPSLCGYHDRPVTAVYMQLNCEYDCDILLLLDVEEEKKLAALMTSASSPDEVDPEMGASAIEELGNILIGSFLNAISDFTGVKLVPTHPQRVTDSFDAIIDNFLVKQALFSDVSLIFETRFRRGDGDASCILMLFPSRKLYKVLVGKSKIWLE